MRKRRSRDGRNATARWRENHASSPREEIDIGGRFRLVIMPVATLLMSVGLLVLGNGLQSTLLVVRAGHEGFSSETIGITMSAYFAGCALGSLFLPRVVASAGHIRTFASGRIGSGAGRSPRYVAGSASNLPSHPAEQK
jgi:MFS family permease